MVKLNRILAALDSSYISEKATSFALRLAERQAADVHLVTVEVEKEELFDTDNEIREEQRISAEEAEKDFQLRCERLLAESAVERQNLNVTPATVYDATPAAGIVSYAKKHKIDLIVTGTHGRQGVSRALLGSVAAEVLRSAPCPVLTVRADKNDPPESIKKIVVPVDFSAPSKAAIKYGSRLARSLSAQLYIVHVMEKVDGADEYGFRPSVFGTAEAYRRVQEALRGLGNGTRPPAQYRVLDGRPAAAITDFAQKAGIDLIIMPTRGQSGLRRLLMGSVAESVISTSPCPVISAKEFTAHLSESAVTEASSPGN